MGGGGCYTHMNSDTILEPMASLSVYHLWFGWDVNVAVELIFAVGLHLMLKAH